eukprot:m.110032 g.110032  ORF g.110032 m.110032 type:complete len:156 (+) comp28005_c0_seq3:490-957(+)
MCTLTHHVPTIPHRFTLLAYHSVLVLVPREHFRFSDLQPALHSTYLSNRGGGDGATDASPGCGKGGATDASPTPTVTARGGATNASPNPNDNRTERPTRLQAAPMIIARKEVTERPTHVQFLITYDINCDEQYQMHVNTTHDNGSIKTDSVMYSP